MILVDPNARKLIVVTDEGDTLYLTANDSTKILIDGNSGAIVDISSGDTVTVNYNITTMLATEIQVETENQSEPPATSTQEATGKVILVDPNARKLIVVTNAGDTLYLTANDSTKILIQGSSGAMVDISSGDTVTVQYVTGTMLATEIQVET